MGLEIRAIFEPLRTLAFGGISGAYAAVGTALSHPARIVIIQNFTDAQMTFTFNSSQDQFTLPTNGQMIIDLTTNQTVAQQFYIAQNSTLFVKQTSGAATSGSVYFSVIYGAS